MASVDFIPEEYHGMFSLISLIFNILKCVFLCLIMVFRKYFATVKSTLNIFWPKPNHMKHLYEGETNVVKK